LETYSVVITTLSTEQEAAELARALVESRLVACVNIIPKARSIYRYDGVIQDDNECLLLMKTRTDAYSRLAERVRDIHPYEVPELIALPIDRGSADYLAWVGENVR